MYVADSGNHRVEKFTSAGAFVAAWGWGVSDGAAHSEVCTSACQAGVPGNGAGQFTTPSAVAVDNSGGLSDGDVYVGDHSTGTVEQFDSSGDYLRTFTASGGGEFGPILGVAVDLSGNLWVYDAAANVFEFDDSGSEIRRWNTYYGPSTGLAVDGSDNVYVVRGCGCVEGFSVSGFDFGELDSRNVATTGLAMDPLSDALFSDQGEFVASYEKVSGPPATVASTFGQGTLTKGTGVAVDTSTHTVYVADATSNEVFVFAPPPPEPPAIEAAQVDNVLATSAEVSVRIRPGSLDTNYRIEYGSTLAYGTQVPLEGADVGSGSTPVTSAQLLTGLAPGTLYYYRVVATNSQGSASWAGEKSEFTTFALTGQAFLLPDERQFELVTPQEKNGADILEGTTGRPQASPDGDRVTYASLVAFGGSPTSKIDQFVATRTQAGWTSEPIVPVASEVAKPNVERSFVGFSEDLSAGVLLWPNGELTPEATVGDDNLYLRSGDGAYDLITVGAPFGGGTPRFVGGSADYRDLLFEAESALTAGAMEGSKNVYEWSDGKVSLVSIPPHASSGIAGAYAGSDGGSLQNAISADGGTVFWGVEGNLYVRVDGAESVKLNTSLRKDSLGDGNATFYGATPSGESAFFADETPLTESSADNGGLYQFNTVTGHLTDLTPHESGSPGVDGLVGFSADGSYVYFVATQALETVAGDKVATAGQVNLFVEHHGTVSFIATLAESDSGDWKVKSTERTAAATGDGQHLAFESLAQLTGYDNLDANGQRNDTEVFEYDFGSGAIRCVSCNPTGEPPIGESSLPRWSASNYSSYYLSESGDRLFFNSSDALVARDTNSVSDVYEWERRGTGNCTGAADCAELISTGTSDAASVFLDAGADGNNVFIATRSRLVPEDEDENYDIYDARVDGGFPSQPSLAACSGDSCQGPLSAPPEAARPLTELITTDPGERAVGTGKPTASFHVIPIASRQLRKVARTGRLSLAVDVSEVGSVSARITARLGHGVQTIASDSVTSAGSGRVALTLRLSRAARARLVVARSVAAAISIRYSRTSQVRHLTVVLKGRGSR